MYYPRVDDKIWHNGKPGKVLEIRDARVRIQFLASKHPRRVEQVWTWPDYLSKRGE